MRTSEPTWPRLLTPHRTGTCELADQMDLNGRTVCQVPLASTTLN